MIFRNIRLRKRNIRLRKRDQFAKRKKSPDLNVMQRYLYLAAQNLYKNISYMAESPP